MRTFLRNVAVFDTGGRGATTSFIERGIGDVLISFESEVNNIRGEDGSDDYEVIVPPVSILAEFPVAVVGENAERNGNSDLADSYLEYLYREDTQRLLAGFNYRVHDETVVAEFADQFPNTELLEVEDVFGSWEEAMENHFEGGALLITCNVVNGNPMSQLALWRSGSARLAGLWPIYGDQRPVYFVVLFSQWPIWPVGRAQPCRLGHYYRRPCGSQLHGDHRSSGCRGAG